MTEQKRLLAQAASMLAHYLNLGILPAFSQGEAEEWRRRAAKYLEKKRTAIQKQSKKESIRKLENGIKIFRDGREKCVTKAAKDQRATEVWQRDRGICQYAQNGIICGVPVLCRWGNLHHKQKRSVNRDDRERNLVLICPAHHYEHHQKAGS